MTDQQHTSWHEMTDEIMTGLRDWRTAHPDATLRDIERELDDRLARMRARMLEDVAQAHAATTWSDADPPMCPDCHVPLTPHGQRERTLQTRGGHPITLTRAYGVCPQCHRGIFPPR